MTRFEVYDSTNPGRPRLVESITKPTEHAQSSRDRDYGYEAQQAAEKHLSACWEWLDYEENYEDGDPAPAGQNPAVGPFCGCQTCEVREVLAVAWPIIVEYVRNEDPTDTQEQL